MPRQVDHQQRREDIAEAVWRLITGQGLEAVTMRHVATEAGVSLGRVQHYFTNKDEMLVFALETISERVEHRIGARAAELADADEPRSRVRAILIEMLPLDERRLAEARIVFAYLARAAVTTRLAEALRTGAVELQDFLAEQIARGQSNATVSARRDPREEAITLLAVVDGLTAHVLIGQHDADEARQAFDAHLDELFDQ